MNRLLPGVVLRRGQKALSILSHLLKTISRPPHLTRLGASVAHLILADRVDARSPIELRSLEQLGIGGGPIILPPASLWCPPGRGGQDASGLAILATIAKALDCREVFEIGTYRGISALTLALNLPDARIHTLDLPADARPVLSLSDTDAALVRDGVERTYLQFPAHARIEQHLGDSATFDFTPFRRRCGLVYIDGSHSAEYVRSDTQVAFELVTDDRAAVIWDDYWPAAPEVVKFLDELARSRTLYRIAGSRLVLWLSVASESAQAREGDRA